MLGEFEEKVLMAVLANQPQAYGVPIWSTLEEWGRKVNVGAIYTVLGRLHKKGLVSVSEETGGLVRGGRIKKLYTVTGTGTTALNEARTGRATIEAYPVDWGTWGLLHE